MQILKTAHYYRILFRCHQSEKSVFHSYSDERQRKDGKKEHSWEVKCQLNGLRLKNRVGKDDSP